jgi:uncharacterized protein (DUF1015 family)
MPEIRPFAGILYTPGAVPLAQVVAPPYDVISRTRQGELYERSPYNVVRLILGREADPYAAAAASLRSWLASGVLRRDAGPAFYLLSQQFQDLQGRRRIRRGVIGACRLEEFGKGSVLPHERTLAKPKEDRLRLFKATGAMFSQILSLYDDAEGILDVLYAGVVRQSPFFEVEFDGVENTVHRIAEPALQGTITGFLLERPALIADGHHRYETALAYRTARMHEGASGDEAWNFVPMFLTNMRNDDLVLFPTHRLIRDLPAFDGRRFLDQLRSLFDVRPMEGDDALLGALTRARPQAFGLILPGEPHAFLLQALGDFAADHPGDLLWRLDVTVLHERVLKGLLGMSDEQQLQKTYLDYEHDARAAAAAVRMGRAQAAFLMNPTPIEDVRAAAAAGVLMPQKSTYFYPKLLSGVVNYAFDGGEA